MAVDRKRIYHKRHRLRQLRAFCRVVQMGSISGAADALDITQPAVSLQVRDLEHDLSALLVERNHRGIALTPAGERLYELVEPLVQGMDRLSGAFVEQIVEIVSLRIRIGASEAVAASIVPAYLQRFQARYPEMRVRVSTCLVSEGVERLLDGELDLVLGSYANSLRDYKNLLYHHVANYDIVLITALDHPLAGRETVSPEEIAAYPAIAPDPQLYSRYSQDIVGQHFGFDMNVLIEVGQWGVIKRYVEQGLGISIVPSLCLSEDDALSTIALKDHFPTRSYGVITRRGRYLTPAARDLVRIIAPDYSV